MLRSDLDRKIVGSLILPPCGFSLSSISILLNKGQHQSLLTGADVIQKYRFTKKPDIVNAKNVCLVLEGENA